MELFGYAGADRVDIAGGRSGKTLKRFRAGAARFLAFSWMNPMRYGDQRRLRRLRVSQLFSLRFQDLPHSSKHPHDARQMRREVTSSRCRDGVSYPAPNLGSCRAQAIPGDRKPFGSVTIPCAVLAPVVLGLGGEIMHSQSSGSLPQRNLLRLSLPSSSAQRGR